MSKPTIRNEAIARIKREMRRMTPADRLSFVVGMLDPKDKHKCPSCDGKGEIEIEREPFITREQALDLLAPVDDE